MKKLVLISYCLLLLIQFVQATPKYKIRIVTKEKKVFRGTFESINDSTLQLKTRKGELKTLTAPEIKYLNIYRPHIAFYCGIVGAVALGIAASTEPDELTKAFYIGFGIPIGMSAGMLIGDELNDKIRYKNLNMNDFAVVRAKLQPFTRKAQ